MKGFTNWMEEHFVPVAAKIGAQKHLVAIRDGFIGIMPVTMAGAFAVLLNVFARDLPNKYLPGPDGAASSIAEMFSWLININGAVWWGTIAMLAIAFSFSFGYSLAKAYDVDALPGGLISIASFLTVLPQDGGTFASGWGNIQWNLVNANGLFTALIVGLVCVTIYAKLMQKGITIKLPEQVPPAVSKAFAAIIPGVVAIFVAGIAYHLCSQFTALVPHVTLDPNVTDAAGNPAAVTSYSIAFKNVADVTVTGLAAEQGLVATAGNVPQIIQFAIANPFLKLTQGLGAILVIVIMVQLFWFFGLHGVNVLGAVIEGPYLTTLLANQDLATNGTALEDLPYLWTRGSFDAYVWMGGSGCTIALLIAILIFSKKEEARAVAKLSAPMGLFNINEPVIFGLPIVLNPVYFIPWMVAPVVLTCIAYGATAAGIIPPVYVQLPWVIPPVIYAFLATGANFMAALVALLNIVVCVLIFTPFVMMANRVENTEE